MLPPFANHRACFRTPWKQVSLTERIIFYGNMNSCLMSFAICEGIHILEVRFFCYFSVGVLARSGSLAGTSGSRPGTCRSEAVTIEASHLERQPGVPGADSIGVRFAIGAPCRSGMCEHYSWGVRCRHGLRHGTGPRAAFYGFRCLWQRHWSCCSSR